MLTYRLHRFFPAWDQDPSRHSDSALSQIPTTSRSQSISDLRSPYSQLSAKDVMQFSALSPSSWLRLLKCARSKITFLRILNNPSSFSMTLPYSFLSSALGFVEVRTASASSSRQYSDVFTCQSSLPSWSLEAMWNCLKRLFHRGQSSWFLKLNKSGGCRLSLDIVMEGETRRCYHVMLWLLIVGSKTSNESMQHSAAQYIIQQNQN